MMKILFIIFICATIFLSSEVTCDSCNQYFSNNILYPETKCFLFYKCCGQCENRYCCSIFTPNEPILDQTNCWNTVTTARPSGQLKSTSSRSEGSGRNYSA